jgi:hypothetical protein
VRQRQAFGGPLWDQQTIRQRLSMLDAKTRAARQFLYHCAWRVTQGHDIVQDVSMLKALTGELVNEVVQTCQQFHGGMGFIRETGSSACGAMRACWPLAAAPPKSCSKKPPSDTEPAPGLTPGPRMTPTLDIRRPFAHVAEVWLNRPRCATPSTTA